MFRIVDSECIKKIFDIGYGIKNYNNKANYKAENIDCEKIKRYLIVDLEEYNIQ